MLGTRQRSAFPFLLTRSGISKPAATCMSDCGFTYHRLLRAGVLNASSRARLHKYRSSQAKRASGRTRRDLPSPFPRRCSPKSGKTLSLIAFHRASAVLIGGRNYSPDNRLEVQLPSASLRRAICDTLGASPQGLGPRTRITSSSRSPV